MTDRKPYAGCAPTCPRAHAPHISTPYTHLPTYLPSGQRERGTDRVLRDHAEAMALAERRAPARGRQMIHRHVGRFVGRVWVVQDVQVSR
jgi:hypothetical protein